MKRHLLAALAVLSVLALPAPAAQTGHAVYRPGLTQARIPLYSEWGYDDSYSGVPNLASNLLGLVEEGHSDWLDRTLDVFKDGEHKKNGGHDDDPNPLSGKSWPWSEAIQNSHAVFAYEGEMFVEEGTEYYFFGRMWTGEALVVDGTTVVWQGGGNSWNTAPVIYGSWTAPRTGWVPFNAWLWTWNGGSGDPQWSEWGLQYNVDGFSLDGLSGPDKDSGIRKYAYNVDPNSDWRTNVWKRFVDPGNGTFLRTATTNRFTSASSTDGRTWNLTFEGVPHAAQLVAFWGATDGIHDTNAWASPPVVLAEVPAGNSSTTVSVSPEANATALRFRLAHADETATDGMAVFQEWTEAFPLTAAPVVRVDAVHPGFTNVVVSGELAALGRDGAPATVTIQIADAADAAFADPIVTNLPAVSEAGPFEIMIQGLATNAAYLARAIATATSCSTSSVVSFRTARPTSATASAEVVAARFFEAEVAAVVSDWGAGATGAEVWIDVAPDDTFAPGETRTVSLGILSGHLPATAIGTIEDIPAATDFRARIRLRNSWGLESESPSVALRTSENPLVFPTPETTAANGYVSVSLSPSYVATGTVYSVRLWTTGSGITGWVSPVTGEWDDRTDDGPFEWSHTAVSGAHVQFRFEISWTNGELGSGNSPIIVEADTMWSAAADYAKTLAELDALTVHPGRPNLYLRPGETVELIPSTNGVSFAWHTNAVISVSTNGIVTALEPGVTLLYEQDSSGKTNNVVGAVVVLPAADPAGGIYLHREMKHWSWHDTNEWEVIAPGPQGYPDAPGSYAYIFGRALGLEETVEGRKITITNEVTVGYLAVGQLGWIHHSYVDKSHWPWMFEGKGSIRFETTDGSASWIRFLGHSWVTSIVDFNVPISLANDLDFDELNRVQDTDGWKTSRYSDMSIQKPVSLGPYTFRTIRTHPYPYVWGGGRAGGMRDRGWISIENDILGSGTIRLEAASAVGFLGSEGRIKSFTGVWDVANGDLDHLINSQYGAAALNVAGGGIGRAKELIVRGSWHRADKHWPRGALVRTGFPTVKDISAAWTNDWQEALPPKITLDGGCLQLYPQGSGASSTWRNVFAISNLTIKAGSMGRLESRFTDKNDNYLSGRPNVFTTITNLVLEPNAVVSFNYDASTASVQNEFVISNNCGWIPDASATSQFLPFFFANNQREGTGGTYNDMSFTTRDNTHLAFRDRETGKVSLMTAEEAGVDYKRWTAGEELADGSYYSMQLAANVTNSFAEEATVRNLAGYLDIRKGSVLGRLGDDAGATLDFGDQPARIFNGNWGEVGTIGCKLAGTAGLVTGGNGTIALAASAAGVSGGVRVAGGTLELLDEAVRRQEGTNVVQRLARGRIAGDVRVEAGSRLVVHGSSCFAPGVQLFLNDRDWIPSYGHVRLDLDPQRPTLYVRELVIGGRTMPHGYYGSSEAAVVHPDINVDDVHFEGPGVLWAGVLPTMMIFR